MKTPDPYASGVLDKEVHARLVADLDNVAHDAGILPHWIWTPLGGLDLTEKEVTWLKRFRFHNAHEKGGLMIIGRSPTNLPVELRMAALAGALTRNFIRARMMTVNAFIDLVNDGDVPDMSCILIPNFHVEKAQGGSMPAWRVALLLDGLMQRHGEGLQTVLGVTGLDELGADYGAAMQRFLKSNYDSAKIGG
jgi:hypothetical protein